MLCFVRRLLLFAHDQPIFGCSFGLLSQFVRGLALCPAAATIFRASLQENCDCGRLGFVSLGFSGKSPRLRAKIAVLHQVQFVRGSPIAIFLQIELKLCFWLLSYGRFCGERPCNSGVAPYSHASVLNLRVSGGAFPATGGISSLADEACGGRAWIGMLATIECSGHLPELA